MFQLFPITILALATSVTATVRSRQGNNDGIHLAVGPQCGPLPGTVADMNAGLNLNQYKTIVSFGDSYTDGGRHDGGPLAPAVMTPPNTEAGGRSTNGPVWVEDVASDIGAHLMDYAWSSAVTNTTLWPSNPYPRDFIMQTTMFLNQSNNLDPETTLYTIFFGINDWEDSFVDGDHLPQAAQDLLGQISLLSNSPTNAKNFLVTDVYGRGTQDDWGQAWIQSIYDGLAKFRTQKPAAQRWFGYTNTSACVGTSICDDPEHYFYWIPGAPLEGDPSYHG
ncbi:carbohydrate esterase family 16 protein [Lanmaoa asiatica]|nr:carbohydrate esterase family 16 protein [Lanmaoa asiatica]